MKARRDERAHSFSPVTSAIMSPHRPTRAPGTAVVRRSTTLPYC